MNKISKKFLDENLSGFNLNESFSKFENRNDSSDSLYDIFFSYCYSDLEYALKLVSLLEKTGYRVYIDVKDASLNRNAVNLSTVKRIADIIDRCKCLVYLHTKSSQISKWCPRELGYMSGKKNFRCATILLVDDNEEFPRQEYLEIYPYLSYESCANSKVYDFWVNELDSAKYILLRDFLNDRDPYIHKHI